MGWSARLLASRAVKQANLKARNPDPTVDELRAIIARWEQRQCESSPDQQKAGGQ